MGHAELVAGLQACLGERVPDQPARRALAAALHEWAREREELADELKPLLAAVERGERRVEVAVAAAHAMRLVLQFGPAAPGQNAADEGVDDGSSDAADAEPTRGRSWLERVQE